MVERLRDSKGLYLGKDGKRKRRRPKNPLRTARQELLDAINIVEKRKRKKFLVSCVEKAYKSDKMAIAILKKIMPDLKAVEHSGHANQVLANVIIDIGQNVSQNKALPSVNVGINSPIDNDKKLELSQS